MRPDALLIPRSRKQGGTARQRIFHMLDLADRELAVDAAAGEKSYLRDHSSGKFAGWIFATRDPGDTIDHAASGPLAGRSRYRWEAGADGIKRGWLDDPPADVYTGACK